jgi:hypothetical protein
VQWLQPAGAVLAVVLLGFAWTAVFEPAVRYLYSTPRGAWFLALTWLVAVGAIGAGITIRDTYPALGAGLFILPIPVSLFATLIYRDQRRVYLNLPPVTANVPYTLGVVGRTGFVVAALLALAIAALFATARVHDWWNTLCFAVAAIGFLRIAWRGRLLQDLRRHLGAEE